MATVDEIFETMAVVDEELEAAIDAALLFDPNSRQISVPGTELILGVESDGKAERKYFMGPRLVGNNLDLASCFIRINYRNANGEIDSHLVDDVKVVGDSVVFSWELHKKVTLYKGSVKFLVYASLDEDHFWHTTLATGMVLEGLEPNMEAIAEDTQDVVTQLITMVNKQTTDVETVGATQIQKVVDEGAAQVASVEATAEAARIAVEASIEAKGSATLASIPDDYTELSNATQGMSNALRGTASGEVIRLDDVSPVQHYPKVKVSRKNLYHSYTDRVLPMSGLDIEMKSSTSHLVITGVATQTNSGTCGSNLLLHKGTYTVSTYGLNDNGVDRFYIMDNAESKVFTNNISPNSPKTFTLNEDTLIRVKFVINEGSTYSNTEVGVQIESGTVATNYTPYVDLTAVTVGRCGKNLAAYTGETKTDTSSGISLVRTKNSAEFMVNGTATSITSMVATSVVMLPPGTYTASVEGLHTISANTDRCYVLNKQSGQVLAGEVMTNKPKTFTVSQITPVRVEIVLGEGSSYVDATVRIQIESGGDATPYHQYSYDTQVPSSDGTVTGLSALYPTTTLITDTAGVSIECEYSRDINKVIADLYAKLA